jgi:50S ribosomal subunit-associated GTPase HflX
LAGEAGGHGEMRAVAISATTGAGLDGLLAAIDDVLPGDLLVRTQMDLSVGDGATLAMLHEFGRVLSTRYENNRVVVEAEVPESLERRLRVR